MAASPEQIMSMIGKNAPSGSPPGVPTPGEAPSSAEQVPPMGSPMSTPEPKMGNKEAAKVNISMAMDLLEQSLPAFGSESEEGKAVLNAIRAMTSIIGKKQMKTGELQGSEILQLLQSLPQAGGATPESKAMSQAPLIPGMTPPGGAAPGGMPPPGGGAPGTPTPGGPPPM
jgi:hypothetical protein